MWFNFDFGKGPATFYVPARLIKIRSKYVMEGEDGLSDDEIIYFNHQTAILKKRYARIKK